METLGVHLVDDLSEDLPRFVEFDGATQLVVCSEEVPVEGSDACVV